MKSFALLFILFLAVLFIRCTDNAKENKCQPVFFEMQKPSDFFFLESRYSQNNCHYYFEFRFWRQAFIENRYMPLMPVISGNIYQKNDKVVIIPNGFQDTVTFLDFSLNFNQSLNIDLNYKALDFNGDSSIISKKYSLKLLDKFYSKAYHDTIFKFAFDNISVNLEDDDLVFYIGRHVGFQGGYNGDIIYTEGGSIMVENVFSYVGNIFKYRYKTIKFNTKKMILG